MQNYELHLGRYNFKIIVIPKTIEKYTSFSTELPKDVIIDSGLPLVFRGSIHFLNGSLENIGKNDYHRVSQEFNANALQLRKCFLYEYCDSFGSKDNFIIH